MKVTARNLWEIEFYLVEQLSKSTDPEEIERVKSLIDKMAEAKQYVIRVSTEPRGR